MNNINIMDKIKIFIIPIIIICAIYVAIYKYNNYVTQKEAFYQTPTNTATSNPITINNTATTIMKESPFLSLVADKEPTATSILRFNGTKWEPYEFARFSYRVISSLNLSTTFTKLLSAAAYKGIPYNTSTNVGTIYDTKTTYNNNTGGKITFTEIYNGGDGVITINKDCRYKITLNATLFVATIANSVQTDLDLYIYGYDVSDNEVTLGSCSTYIYANNKYISMSIVAFVDNKNKNQTVSKIVPKLRLRPPSSGATVTYTPSNGADSCVNIAIEEY